MDLPIFFLEAFTSQPVLTLDEDTSKHIVQVLRMKPSEKMQLTDGAGNLLTAEIVEDHKKKCTVKIVERQKVQKKKHEVCIGISLLKNVGRFEWFLEKATEIGATEIIPMLCERTEKQHFRYERMKQIVISAMMQSKQVWLPCLQQLTFFSKNITSSDYPTKLIAHCEKEMKISVGDFRGTDKVQILIGPEGDFTREEILLAIEEGYKPVSLGETRLRSETAGVVAATLLCI